MLKVWMRIKLGPNIKPQSLLYKSAWVFNKSICAYAESTVNSDNLRENFIFSSSVKRHICDVENLRQRRDLPISINNRVISPIREDFIFTKLDICKVS